MGALSRCKNNNFEGHKIKSVGIRMMHYRVPDSSAFLLFPPAAK